MSTTSDASWPFHHRPRTLARRRLAFWLLLATGCGSRTSLDLPGAGPSPGLGGAAFRGDVGGQSGNADAGGTQSSGGRAGATGSGGWTGVGGNRGGGPAGSGGAIPAGGAAGTAGIVGSGGAGGGPGSTGGSPSSTGCTMDVDYPGYLHCGPWHGYAWTDTESQSLGLGTVVFPPDFASADGLPFCAQGVVGPAYGAVGLLGFNVNQGPDAIAPSVGTETWAVSGYGIRYEIRNPGGTPLRIQIEGERGWPDEAWCADISGSNSGTLAWSAFNTMCWAPSSPPGYDGKVPFTRVMLLVPGDATTKRAFNICLVSLSPY